MALRIANTTVGAQFLAALLATDHASAAHQMRIGTSDTPAADVGDVALSSELQTGSGTTFTVDGAQTNVYRLYAEFSGFAQSEDIKEVGWFANDGTLLQRLTLDSGIAVTTTSTLKVTLARRQSPQVVTG